MTNQLKKRPSRVVIFLSLNIRALSRCTWQKRSMGGVPPQQEKAGKNLWQAKRILTREIVRLLLHSRLPRRAKRFPATPLLPEDQPVLVSYRKVTEIGTTTLNRKGILHGGAPSYRVLSLFPVLLAQFSLVSMASSKRPSLPFLWNEESSGRIHLSNFVATNVVKTSLAVTFLWLNSSRQLFSCQENR